MDVRARVCLLLWVLPSLLLLLGCGGDDFNTQLFPVEGEVYFRGKPAVGCIVSFHPKAASTAGASAGVSCLGTTDANGKFRITTRQPFDGIAAGEYEVSFSLPGEGDSAPDKLPNKYQFPATSGINVTITSATSTLPRFELK